VFYEKIFVLPREGNAYAPLGQMLMLEATKQMIVFFWETVVFLKEMLFERTNMLNCSLRLICLLRIWMCFQQKWSC